MMIMVRHLLNVVDLAQVGKSFQKFSLSLSRSRSLSFLNLQVQWYVCVCDGIWARPFIADCTERAFLIEIEGDDDDDDEALDEDNEVRFMGLGRSVCDYETSKLD